MKILLITTILLLISCNSQKKDELIRKQLDIVLDADLVEVIAGVSSDALLESPTYVVKSFNAFDEGKYSYLAEVDFLFLNCVDKKIVRKYRYYTAYKKWDRYLNEYRSITDK